MTYLHGNHAKPGDLLVWSQFAESCTQGLVAGKYAGVTVRWKIPPGGNAKALQIINDRGGIQHLSPVYFEVVRT